MLTIRLAFIGPHLKQQLLAEYRENLKAARELTYEEAAWFYGFTPGSFAKLLQSKAVKPIRVGRLRYVTHVEMRRYMRSKKTTGAPRKSQRTQLEIQ